MQSIWKLKNKKQAQQKISMVTCYDYSTATVVEKSDIDLILVGDSVAMVMHGFDSTIHATLDMIATHTSAVRRGAPSKLIIADMPFLTHRKGKHTAVEAAGELLRSGANAVKIEGVAGHLDTITHLTESGIPVMGHLGLTPQSVHQLGGYRVQGKLDATAQQMLLEAQQLEQAGAFSLVLECVPSALAALIAQTVDIPVIGIGAGVEVDGQVLVMQDLLGLKTDYLPKFVRTYAKQETEILSSLNIYHQDVLQKTFPSSEESYL